MDNTGRTNNMQNNENLAEDFVITGFAKVEGKWITLGSIPGVTVEGCGPVEADGKTVATGTSGSGCPQLALRDVAGKLNELEHVCDPDDSPAKMSDSERNRLDDFAALDAASRPNVTYGQTAYEAYFKACDGKSLISGAPLPAWADQASLICDAWCFAAATVVSRVDAESAKLDGAHYRQLLDLCQKRGLEIGHGDDGCLTLSGPTDGCPLCGDYRRKANVALLQNKKTGDEIYRSHFCLPHLKISDRLEDYPTGYGCPQCQRNRTCELEEIAAELLTCLRIIVICEQSDPNRDKDGRRRAYHRAANAIEAADCFAANDSQTGGCLNEQAQPQSAGNGPSVELLARDKVTTAVIVTGNVTGYCGECKQKVDSEHVCVGRADMLGENNG